MAGGKETPRQKMINLMYLIFIAMLALNIGKEVLAAFGVMNEKFEASNEKAIDNNLAYMDGLATKAEENSEKYQPLYVQAEQVKKISDEYYAYLEGLKTDMLEGYEDKRDYEKMDKSDFLDQKFFGGDKVTPEGKKFLDWVTNYRTQVQQVLPESMSDVKAAVATRFETGDSEGKVTKGDGTKEDWLNYHYERVPMVVSLTKITAMQSDIKATEQDVLKGLLEGNLTEAVSLKNFATSLAASKSAFYNGDKYDGKIIISKTDNSSTPERAELTLDGRKLTEGKDYRIEAGGVQMLIGAGSPGDHEITGTLFFKQDGEEIPVEVKNSFATISKPNAAVIAADKMNVVYRGVANPMTISIPGIPDNKVSASAAGLSKRSGSKYVMNPGKGREVTITASGILPDGQRITTPSTFRIKDIPRPSGAVRGEAGSIKMPRKNLEVSTISAMLEDFDFELNIGVSGFKFKVPGQPTVVVNGNKMNAAAKSALKRARRGDAVQVFDIQAYISNNKSYKLKKVSPVVVELTN